MLKNSFINISYRIAGICSYQNCLTPFFNTHPSIVYSIETSELSVHNSQKKCVRKFFINTNQWYSDSSKDKDESLLNKSRVVKEVLKSEKNIDRKGGLMSDVVKGIEKAKTLVKVVPKIQRSKTDFSKPHTENIFITPIRALNEYLLSFQELANLTKYKRRSPYPESDDITVYLRREVEKKALEKWGNLEKLRNERKRRKFEEHFERKNLFESDIRRAIDQYNKQHEARTIESDSVDERPFIFKNTIKNSPNPVSIFKLGSGKVIIYAITINVANCIMKLIAWFYTGSHSMFSEFIHSLADSVNQIILAVGLHQSLKQPDMAHPYGWSNFRNVSSLISGVGIFCLGAGLSWYHGIHGLLSGEPIESLFWAIAILGGSFVSEGATLLIAINQIRHASKIQGVTPWTYVFHGYDPGTNVVLLEDAAAVIGVVMASSCMLVTQITGSHIPDAIGSLLIGTLLSTVASFIIYTNSVALVGRSIPNDKKLLLTEELEKDRMIRCLHDVKATDMGGSYVRFKAEVDFDGRELTRKYLESIDLEKILVDMKNFKSVEDVETFMLKHGEYIIDVLGSEVDRIEKNLKQKHPEIRHVDLEQL